MTEIDFDSLPAGTVVTNQFAALGVQISLAGGVSPGGPQTTTVSAATYPDMTPPNVLVPATQTPDVLADIVFDFAVPVDFVSLWAFDMDEPLTMSVFLGATQVATQSTGFLGDTAARQFTFGSVGGALVFDRLLVDLVEGAPGSLAAGPEFYDTLRFHLTAALPALPPSAAPAPAPLALLGLGMATLLLVRRRTT